MRFFYSYLSSSFYWLQYWEVRCFYDVNCSRDFWIFTLYDENMILKNLVLCVVRAYFENSITLKVHRKVYSGIAGRDRIEMFWSTLNTLQKNWRGADIHSRPANTNERYFIRFLIASFPLKYSYHPIGMSYRTALYGVWTRFWITTRPQSMVFVCQQMTFFIALADTEKNDFFLYFNHYFPDSSSKYKNMFKIFSSSYEHRRPLQYLCLTYYNQPNR